MKTCMNISASMGPAESLRQATRREWPIGGCVFSLGQTTGWSDYGKVDWLMVSG